VKVTKVVLAALQMPWLATLFTEGEVITFTIFVEVSDPFELVTMYKMVSIPAETPVTTALETVAVALLLCHVPPPAPGVKVMDEPAHTFEGPVKLPPEFGEVFAFTVIPPDTDKAPLVVRALPLSIDPVLNSIAPLFAMIFPLKTELSFILTAPFTNQYTFCDWAPFVKITLDNVLVEMAPFIFIINTALTFPSEFR
jgi:hypothetical protein